MKEFERRFTHHFQYLIRRVFRGDFQTAGDVVLDQLFGIFIVVVVFVLFFILANQQIMANTAGYKSLFHFGMSRSFFININKRLMVCVQIVADRRMDAGWTDAFVADGLILPFHFVHIAGRPPQITDVALKIRHLCDLLHFSHDGRFRPTGNHLALMG